MRKFLIGAVLLLASMAFGQGGTTSSNIIPANTGQDLGTPTQQWDLFSQDTNIYRFFKLNNGTGLKFFNIQPNFNTSIVTCTQQNGNPCYFDSASQQGIPGPPGPAGASGAAGTNGADGAPGVPGYSPNQIVEGCGVVWDGGLIFTVSRCTYIIGNITYTAPQTTVTLGAADPTDDRFDAIIADTSQVISVLPGTPSPTPVAPSLDISSQIQLSAPIWIPALATAPANIVTTDIYHENTEWTCASSSNVNCASTSTPHAGSVNVLWTNAATNNYERHTIPAGNIDLATRDNLAFWILPSATWATTRSVTVRWYNGTTAKCTPVSLRDGNFGFDSTNHAWQQIVIPTTTFACSGIPVTRLQFTEAGTGTNLTFHMDDIILQGGVPPGSGPAGQGACNQDWNNSTSYPVNACVFYATTGSSYTAIQANTNVIPSSDTTRWKVFETHAPAGVLGNLQYNAGNGSFAAVPNSYTAGSDVNFGTLTLKAYAFESTNLVDNTQITGVTGTGGDSTCPTPVAGSSFFCIQSNEWYVSQNGAAYAPIVAAATPGTVTSFSAGTLSPLFTTSVATATTTPALSFALSTAGAHTFLGNNTGSTTAPAYSAITVADLPTAAKTQVCEVVVGDPGAASTALADDNDTPDVCANITGADMTITAVACKSDGGSPTSTPILTGGSSTSIVTGAITCSTSWSAGTVNGTPTIHSFSANGATCSSTPCTLDSNITAAGGTAKYIVWHFTLSQ